jgi:putative endonuclease
VYILRSEADPNRHDVGNASDVDERLEWHNHGPCGFTVSHRPWRLAVSIEFPTELEALRFERYLNSGSGRVFAKRHFGTTLRAIRIARLRAVRSTVALTSAMPTSWRSSLTIRWWHLRTTSAYSTFGYTLASIVLEEAAGMPFLELLQQKIAAPLGLASLTVDAPRRVITGRESGYGPASQVREVPPVSGVWANAPTNNPASK